MAWFERTLAGVGIMLAGIGAVLSGWAAIRAARKYRNNDRKEPRE